MILSPDLRDIEKQANSDAERRLARLLSKIPGPKAVAFHSVKLHTHAYKHVAEIDFLILWKDVAIVVEVKGGGVQKYEGVWYSIDRNRDAHRLPSSPMEQARSAMFALLKIFDADNMGKFASEAIVITPDIDSPPSSTEWKPSQWLTSDSMNVEKLVEALDLVAAEARRPRSDEKRASSQELRTRLFGEFSRLPVIDAQRGAVLDEQARATEQQAKVLAGLAKNERIVVLGGAGTGKSLVLAEAAKQEAEGNRSVLVTFRSKGLQKLFKPLFEGRDITVTPFEDLVPGREFDVLLVDEAQDLMHVEAMDSLDKMLVGGRSKGRWRMFLDHNNQAHVDGSYDKDVFDLVRDEAIEYDLSLNVRNTRAIVHMVQEYLSADVGDPGIVNGERIDWNWLEDGTPQEAAIQRAKKLIDEGAIAKNIWVISVTADADLDEVVEGIRVLAPRQAKGLEAEHAIVCELPEEYDDVSLANFYVAVTRARISLHVIASKKDKKKLLTIGRKKALSH
ncbi:NERD domain-containing protein [Arthrobacter sp. JCM 19049]|uniref:nuclease-related domain-containing DEAD/DEAH box helicase n=1 Tax=Arthrobacter sp. JCM 19049 TaxID=1460643 RepID=UPI0006D1C47B|nr:NERD domain-containing protein [Arthrobacter sp. JCM 19049]